MSAECYAIQLKLHDVVVMLQLLLLHWSVCTAGGISRIRKLGGRMPPSKMVANAAVARLCLTSSLLAFAGCKLMIFRCQMSASFPTEDLPINADALTCLAMLIDTNGGKIR